jgi:hypothetical protein
MCVVSKAKKTALISLVKRFLKFHFMYFTAQNHQQDNIKICYVIFLKVTILLGV